MKYNYFSRKCRVGFSNMASNRGNNGFTKHVLTQVFRENCRVHDITLRIVALLFGVQLENAYSYVVATACIQGGGLSVILFSVSSVHICSFPN